MHRASRFYNETTLWNKGKINMRFFKPDYLDWQFPPSFAPPRAPYQNYRRHRNSRFWRPAGSCTCHPNRICNTCGPVPAHGKNNKIRTNLLVWRCCWNFLCIYYDFCWSIYNKKMPVDSLWAMILGIPQYKIQQEIIMLEMK